MMSPRCAPRWETVFGIALLRGSIDDVAAAAGPLDGQGGG
jgi:hypothetical protein